MAASNRRTVFSTDPEPEVLPAQQSQGVAPRQQAVRVGIERKGRGGKTVSLVSGVMGAPAEVEKLCKQLKNSLGTGGAVKGQIIEIQGDQRDKIVAILQGLGYQAKKAGG